MRRPQPQKCYVSFLQFGRRAERGKLVERKQAAV